MSFVGPGDVVTYLYWLEQVQKLGLGDTRTPGEKERRMFEESGEFDLKVWNGEWVTCNRNAAFLNGNNSSYYLNAGNLNAGIIGLARIPAVLTGKDADKLDGQEGIYYQNATNMTSGTLSRGRLGGIWRDNTSGETNNPYFQTGANTIPNGSGSETINFAVAYSQVPRVAIGANYGQYGAITVISTTGFQMQKGSYSYDAYWLALGRKD